ncbi:hypothetical protein ABK040_005486 [Willaertia magna]
MNLLEFYFTHKTLIWRYFLVIVLFTLSALIQQKIIENNYNKSNEVLFEETNKIPWIMDLQEYYEEFSLQTNITQILINSSSQFTNLSIPITYDNWPNITSEIFEQKIKGLFIQFYSPHSIYCQAMVDVWKELNYLIMNNTQLTNQIRLGTYAMNDRNSFVFASRDMMRKHIIHSFPHLVFFWYSPKSRKENEEPKLYFTSFKEERTTENLLQFIEEQVDKRFDKVESNDTVVVVNEEPTTSPSNDDVTKVLITEPTISE